MNQPVTLIDTRKRVSVSLEAFRFLSLVLTNETLRIVVIGSVDSVLRGVLTPEEAAQAAVKRFGSPKFLVDAVNTFFTTSTIDAPAVEAVPAHVIALPRAARPTIIQPAPATPQVKIVPPGVLPQQPRTITPGSLMDLAKRGGAIVPPELLPPEHSDTIVDPPASHVVPGSPLAEPGTGRPATAPPPPVVTEDMVQRTMRETGKNEADSRAYLHFIIAGV